MKLTRPSFCLFRAMASAFRICSFDRVGRDEAQSASVPFLRHGHHTRSTRCGVTAAQLLCTRRRGRHVRCLAAAAVHAAITLLHCGVHFGSLAIVLPPAPSPAICKTLDIHSCSAHKQAGKTDMNQTCPEVCSAQKGDEESRCYVPAGMRTHAALCLLMLKRLITPNVCYLEKRTRLDFPT